MFPFLILYHENNESESKFKNFSSAAIRRCSLLTYRLQDSYNRHFSDSAFLLAAEWIHQSYQIKISLKCTDICWNLVYQYILVYVIILLDKLEFNKRR